MNIKLVAFEDGIACVGFRRISSLVKSAYPSATSYIYNVGGSYAIAKNALLQKKVKPLGLKPGGGILERPNGRESTNTLAGSDNIYINPDFIREISAADVIAFSGMSKFASHIKKAISLLSAANKDILYIWGGIHASVFPEDAISYAHAVCIGEGEKSFPLLLDKIAKGHSFDDAEGFWVNRGDRIIKNRLMPLMDNEELSAMPFQDYDFDIRYAGADRLSVMTKDIYISQEGSKYATVWSLGCPFQCTYCSNNKFIKNNRNYALIRHSSVEFVIAELEDVLKKHDYVTYIEISDDNFFMLETNTIERFAALYKRKIGLPFFIPGLHPLTVDREKIDILIKAGLKKIRMGIQSGSSKTLSFYRRNTNNEVILKASAVLSSFVPRIIPLLYDIIIDNPVESQDDKMETLSLLRLLKKPYILYIYSLRAIPGTEIYEFALNNPQFVFYPVEHTYQSVVDKQMAMMCYLIAVFKMPDPVFRLFFRLSKINLASNLFFNILNLGYLFKKLYYELRLTNLYPLTMISPRLPVWIYALRKKIRLFKSKKRFRAEECAKKSLLSPKQE